MDKKLGRFLRLYPWFAGFSADLLFWVAVDTLFLQLVKGLTLSEIVLTSSIAYACNILLQFPLTRLVEACGNTRAVRLGAFSALLSALLLTFGQGIAVITAGRVMREVAFSCQSMNNAMLKNNLELMGRENEYIAYTTKGSMIYSVTTAIISLLASLLFNLHPYLPMLLCILFCLLCCLLSLWMTDYSSGASAEREAQTAGRRLGLKLPKLILVLMLAYGLFFAIVETGQQNSKLFLQNEMLKVLTEDHTSLLIGTILLISRFARILSNALFYRIYAKLQDRVAPLLALLLASAFGCMLIGYGLSAMPAAKFALMGFGYILILFVRDPEKHYSYNILLKTVGRADQQKVLMLLELMRKVQSFLLSTLISTLLIADPMWMVCVLYVSLGAVQIGIAAYLYGLIKAKRKDIL